MKKNNNKGFTLAELLIVVAIIAVLTAIAIPVFSTQLEKAKEATDLANLRAAYAEVNTVYIESGELAVRGVKTEQTTSAWVTSNPLIGKETPAAAGAWGWKVEGVTDTDGFKVQITPAADEVTNAH